VILRPYQQTTLDKLIEWFERNPEGNPIVAACVGAGKSVMIAELCRIAARGFEYRSRVLVTVPSKELLEQNYAKMIAVAPDLRIGIKSASVGRKDHAFDKDIVIATPGSVVKNPGDLGRLDLVMVDECHLIPNRDVGQYRKLIAGCQRFNPDLRVIGWTGTPFRGNGVWLHSGEERLFHDIAARVTLQDLLAQGYLSPLVPTMPNFQISGDGVRTSGDDYVISALAEKLDQAELIGRVADEICRLGADRKKWLVFAVTVQHAQHIAAALQYRGISATHVSGETPKAERDRIILGFRHGRYRAMVNVAVLTTGFDVPEVDLLALVRNTKSPVLYSQIAGRAMRISPGKTDALWLDFTDTTANLGPVDEIRGRNEPKAREGEATAPFKLCPECGASSPAGAAVCANEECGFVFPPPEPKVYAYTSGAAILSNNKFGYKEINIARTTYRSHQSKRTDQFMLRADYWSGMRIVASEYVCLEHEGYARQKAERWWRERYAGKFDLPVPTSVAQALDMVPWLREPKQITVKFGEKFPELVAAKFE
jgi:DNA repair protein RadD